MYLVPFVQQSTQLFSHTNGSTPHWSWAVSLERFSRQVIHHKHDDRILPQLIRTSARSRINIPSSIPGLDVFRDVRGDISTSVKYPANPIPIEQSLHHHDRKTMNGRYKQYTSVLEPNSSTNISICDLANLASSGKVRCSILIRFLVT